MRRSNDESTTPVSSFATHRLPRDGLIPLRSTPAGQPRGCLCPLRSHSLLSIATMKILRLPLPPRAFAFRSAVGSPGCLLFLGDCRPKAGPAVLDLVEPVWSSPALSRGDRRLSRASLETPVPLCPALRPRADLHARPSRRFSIAPAVPRTKAPPLESLSRLHHTASRLAAYA